MSRTTQYIGLTRQAMNYLSDYVRDKESKNHTYGMFDEEVPLGEWDDKSSYGGMITGVRKFNKIVEVVQEAPWSSGMMIFTCLDGYFHNDPECKNPVRMFEWVHDPRITDEFDCEEGLFWV